MKKIRAAVVGVGYLGNFHAQKYQALAAKLNNVELVGVYDANPEQCKKISEQLQTRAFASLEDLIGHVDAVTVATVTPAHFEIANFFLDQGVHVNVEKPICVNVAQGQQLVEKAREKNLILTVGHSERFSPVFSELRKHAQRPQYLEFSRRAPYNSRGGEVSVIHDLMIHDLDLMISIDKSQCRLVSAQAGKIVSGSFDWASAAFEFSSGLKSVIHCSRINPIMERTVRWIDQSQEIIGDFNKSELTISRWNPTEKKLNFETLSLGKADNLYTETENFIAAILKQVPPTVPGVDGLKALEIAEEINALVQSRRLY